MAKGDWYETAGEVRRQLKAPVYEVVAKRMGDGWRLRDEGHKFYLYCPCGDPRGRFRVDGTPRDPDWHARRLDRDTEHCPDNHDLDGHRR